MAGRSKLQDIALSEELNTRGLNDQQTTWLIEYMQCWNGVEAAKKAGYANPQKASNRLMKNEIVREAIASLQRRNVEIAIISKEQILQELSVVANKDFLDLCDPETGTFYIDSKFDFRKLDPKIRRCIETVEIEEKRDRDGNVVSCKYKVILSDKLRAIEMLMKHFGMNAPQEVNINVDLEVWDNAFEQARHGKVEDNDIDAIQSKIDAVVDGKSKRIEDKK